MTKIRFSNRALADLASIEDYTVRVWGKRQAVTYLQQLQDRLHWLAGNSQLGKNRDEVISGLYSYPEGRHVIFYRANECRLEVARILHQSMDIDQQFSCL